MTIGFNDKEALRYPLFQDDFGSPDDRVLTDEIRTARKARTCCECLGPIIPGARYRYHAAVYDGALRTYAFCDECCAAMAKVFNGDWLAMDARSAIRLEREAIAKATGSAA